jgi:hypothetical protein
MLTPSCLPPPNPTHSRRWFEEYVCRLSAGVYGTCAGECSLVDSGLNEGQAISLFPRAHPHAVTAITRGVKVCVCVFIIYNNNNHHLMVHSWGQHPHAVTAITRGVKVGRCVGGCGWVWVLDEDAFVT